ncbi:DUF1850 domain-containing protein [Aquibacillus salsiterrae]|uniref:DUF1850 domain-containing protein n=1 Tax=Aquibacillus salsiterrae TaxID=2950439 RepID=A0A9X4AGN4_9BACI|nr:DUF1850 domain-containing protein [Aquibacillus salsiterrae]MDC3417308.1 DUF1850 domain-containing protein [Aquibacillus salsiterrae]
MTRKRYLLSLTFLLILLAAVLFVPFKTALVFYEGNTDTMKAFLPLEPGDTFQLIWRHSIHLKDVTEKYQVTNDLTIKQYEIVYEEFGIGMPSNAQEGEKFEYKDGKYHISNLNNIFPSMNIRNGKTVSKNRLAWGSGDASQMVWFNDYFKPGAWFTVLVERITLWEYLKGVRISE